MTTEIQRTAEIDLKIRTQARKYPDWWQETVLGRRLWLQQKAIAQSVFHFPRTTVRSCETSGKTFDAAGIALCFLYNFDPSLVITTAPTNRQVEDILWKEIRVAHSQAKYPLEGSLTRKRLELADNRYAVGFATDEPERMLGYHEANVLVIGDDAAGLTDEIYGAIENPISSGNAHLLFISNPTQSVGAFRDTFKSDLYSKFHISAFDTPNFTAFGITEEDIENNTWQDKIKGHELPYPQLCNPAKIAEKYKNWGPGSYLYVVFVKGDFPDAGVNNLIPLSDVEFAMERELDKKDYDKNMRVAALDVAMYGDDECAFVCRQGNKVFEPITWAKQEASYTIGRTARLIREYRPIRTYVDIVGMGGPMYESLKKEIGEDYNVLPFDAGEDALDSKRYLNRRAEGWWNIQGRLERHELDLPQNDKLKSQLPDIRYTYDNVRFKLQIESKEKAKARGSKSPDLGDALMMAFSTRKGGSGSRVWTY